MEDNHLATILEVTINGSRKEIPLFGIFDGHGGNSCSRFLALTLKEYLEKEINNTFKNKNLSDLELFNLLKVTFVKLGHEFIQHYVRGPGSTATIALIIDDQLWVANVGDSRTILSMDNEVLALSEDARLNSEKFKKSVHKRGQLICADENRVLRVNGNLNMSHAVGHSERASGINPRAKITKYSLNNLQNNNYLILGCDGLYDVASSKQISKTIQENAKKLDCTEMALLLVKKAYTTSKDNISAMVIKLNKLPEMKKKSLLPFSS